MERKTRLRDRLLSKKVAEGDSSRMVLGRIVDFGENELLRLYSQKSREDRIIMAHEEHFCTAAQVLVPFIPGKNYTLDAQKIGWLLLFVDIIENKTKRIKFIS